MASQISYIKLIRQNFRQRGWAFALTCIMSLIAMPLIMMIQIENKIQWMNEFQSGFTKADLARWYRTAIGPGGWQMATLVIFSALLLGVTGFSYLHSREKMDFYHSLPMRREHLMAGNYFSGVLMFLIPYGVSYLLVLFVGRANQIEVRNLGIWCAQTVLITVLMFLLFYTLTVLAMIITGKILSGILMSVLLWTYGTIVMFIAEQLCSRYYNTYYAGGDKVVTASPMDVYLGVIDAANIQEMPGAVWYLSILGVTVLMGVLAVFCYRIRPTESAGNVIVFPKIEGAFKIILTIPGALLCGLFVSINAAERDKWFLVSGILAAVLLALIIEFVYHLDLKNIFRVKFSMIFSVVAVVVCFCAFKYDFTGYDEYMPKEAEVEGIAIKFDQLMTYFGDQNIIHSEGKYLEKLEVENNQEIYDMLTEIVREQNAIQEEENVWYRGISVMYHLENGRKVYRYYKTEEKDSRMFAETMLGTKAYFEKIFNVNEISEYTFGDGYLRDLTGYESMLTYTKEEIRELLAVYAKDLEEAGIKELMSGKVIAELSMSYADKEDETAYVMEYIPIYEAFSNVTEYLEMKGCQLNQDFIPSEVVSMTIEDYRDKENPSDYAAESRKTIITEPEKIEELFPYLNRYEFNSIWDEAGSIENQVEVSIVWKNGSINTYRLEEEGVKLL